MIIDLTHYSIKFDKTLHLLTHIAEESSMNDGVVLMSLKDINPYLDLIRVLIIKLKAKQYDVELLNQIIAESEVTKLQLRKLYEPRLKLFGNIREIFIKIVDSLNSINKSKNLKHRSEFIITLKDLIITLLSSEDLDELPSVKDKATLTKLSESLAAIDFNNLTDESKYEFLTIKTQLISIADRYHLHYLEISELSKMQPSLIDGSDTSFLQLAQNILDESSGAKKTLKKLSKVSTPEETSEEDN